VITVDNSDPTPPFEQLRRQLVDSIRSGDLAAGQKLPSVRQLAGDLSLAPGTVARAYGALESDRLVETNRTGTRVRPNESLSESIRAEARRYVRATRGTTLDDALRAVKAEWNV
jgi:DNA-binding transcriptional regulator YhcF (GntR family)